LSIYIFDTIRHATYVSILFRLSLFPELSNALRRLSHTAELSETRGGAPRRNAGLTAERMGDGWGNCAMRFSGIVLPRKENKTKKVHESL
jgi:hypothetical protein